MFVPLMPVLEQKQVQSLEQAMEQAMEQ